MKTSQDWLRESTEIAKRRLRRAKDRRKNRNQGKRLERKLVLLEERLSKN